jgi:lysophospholipase L1-like esterase
MATRRAAKLAAPFLACVALLLGVELAVRALVAHHASRDFFLTLFGDPPDATSPEHEPLFEGDPRLFWRLRPGVRTIWDFTVVSTNAQGLRHDGPIGAKPPGALRIVCLGDSVTFGYRVPLVFPDAPEQWDRTDAPYPGRLERILRERFPGREVEVIALAVPGYSTHQGLLLLERWIGRLEPDVVVICFGFNDVALKYRPDDAVMTRDPVDTALRAVVASSQALLHAWRWWTARPDPDAPPPPAPQPRVSPERYLGNVTAMVDLARAYDARVLVVGPVYRDREEAPQEARRIALYRGLLAQAMGMLGVPYLQVDELTEDGWPANASLFGERIHPSSAGHQLLAARVADALVRDGLVGGGTDAGGGA